MVKHIILWKLKETLTGEEKERVKAGIKEGLEGLKGKIPGLLDIKVQANGLPSSNADVMLDSARFSLINSTIWLIFSFSVTSYLTESGVS